MEIYSERTKKVYNVSVHKKDEKNGSMLLTHSSFLSLYQQVQAELGLTIKAVGTPKDWMCFDRIAVPVLLTDKDGNEEFSIGEACKATLCTEIANQYPVKIAYNRGFDSVLRQYMQLPDNITSDSFKTDEVIDNDGGVPAEKAGMVQHDSSGKTQMLMNMIPAPTPVAVPENISIEANPVQGMPEIQIPIPQPVSMSVPGPYQNIQELASQPASMPVPENIPVYQNVQTVTDTEFPMPQPVQDTGYIQNIPASVTADDPSWHQPITFGPLAYADTPMTIATAPKEGLQWYIDNISEDSKFFYIRQNIEAFLAANPV